MRLDHCSYEKIILYQGLTFCNISVITRQLESPRYESRLYEATSSGGFFFKTWKCTRGEVERITK